MKTEEIKQLKINDIITINNQSNKKRPVEMLQILEIYDESEENRTISILGKNHIFNQIWHYKIPFDTIDKSNEEEWNNYKKDSVKLLYPEIVLSNFTNNEEDLLDVHEKDPKNLLIEVYNKPMYSDLSENALKNIINNLDNNEEEL